MHEKNIIKIIIFLFDYANWLSVCLSVCLFIHYIAKSIRSPPSYERIDYFSNFHEYKS